MPAKKETPADTAKMEPTPGSQPDSETPPEVHIPVTFEAHTIPPFQGEAAEFTANANISFSLVAHLPATDGPRRSHFQLPAGESAIIPVKKAQSLIDRGLGSASLCDNPHPQIEGQGPAEIDDASAARIAELEAELADRDAKAVADALAVAEKEAAEKKAAEKKAADAAAKTAAAAPKK